MINRHEQGFTLVEVLMSIVIMMIGFVAVFSLVSM
ncbi:MAG TPA: prepilin-type N-terminal cleavage/methylation domain-containing protein, partial [Gammaproteobacteria bacterium]|nr:prepilin-type N-terminal cleavage/methylation domain-containing protein [Gammaproteobacteria bacterium]